MDHCWENRLINGQAEYRDIRQTHWDDVAASMEQRRGLGGYYHKRLSNLIKFIIPAGQKVLEIGSGDGDLLSSVEPCLGIGIDLSQKMCSTAKSNHPDLLIIQADAHYLPINEKFDFIILSDLINDLWDVQQVLKQVQRLCHKRTRIIINS